MYKFNPTVEYKVGPFYNEKSIDFDNLNISVTTSDSFHAKVPALFSDYLLPKIASDVMVRLWNNHPIQFYQNQHLHISIYPLAVHFPYHF